MNKKPSVGLLNSNDFARSRVGIETDNDHPVSCEGCTYRIGDYVRPCRDNILVGKTVCVAIRMYHDSFVSTPPSSILLPHRM